LLPKRPVFLDPSFRIAQRRSDKSTSTHAPFAPDIGESRALQHPQMLADSRECHVELRRELPNRALAPRELYEYRTPSWVSQRTERRVERVLVRRGT